MALKNKKIAIYIPDSNWLVPDKGGTFSLPYSIILELDKRMDDTSLILVLVDNKREYNILKQKIKCLQILSLDKESVVFTRDIQSISRKNKLKTKIKRYFRARNLLIKPSVENIEVNSYHNFDHYLCDFVERHDIGLIYYPIQHKCLTTKIPFIATNWDVAHKSTFYFPEISQTFEARETWYNCTLPKSLAIFCESLAGKAELIKYYQFDESKIFIQPLIPGSVVDIRQDQNKQLKILEDLNLTSEEYFFYPAQFWALKNHKTLVEAFAVIANRFDNIMLVLTGSNKGNFKYIADMCVSLNISNKVIMPGFVIDEQLHALYSNALAMIMPTLLGPTNMPILEGMALNCPVFCSNLSGHIEILGSSEQTFSPFDKDRMISIMESCINDDNYRTEIIKSQKDRYLNSSFNKEKTVDYLIYNLNKVRQLRELWN